MQLAGKGMRYAPVTHRRAQPCRAAAGSFAWPEGQRHGMHQQRRHMTGAQQLRPIEREAVLKVSAQQGGLGGTGPERTGNPAARLQPDEPLRTPLTNEPLLPQRPAEPYPADPNIASSALTNDPSGLRETIDITDIDRAGGPGRGGYDDRFGGSGGGRGGSGGGRGPGDDFNDGGRGGMSPFTMLLFAAAVAAGAWYLLRRSPSEPAKPIAYQEPTKEQIREVVHQKVDDVKHGVADAGEKVKSATERAGEKVKQGLQDTTRKAAESLPPEAREKAEEAAETGRKYWREIGTALLWVVGIGLLSSVDGPKKDKKKKPTYTPTVLTTPATTTLVTPTTTATTTPYRAPAAAPATVPAGFSTAPVTKTAPATVTTATATKHVPTVDTAAVTKPVIKDADVTAVVTPVRSGTAVKTAPAAASVHTTGMHGADAVMETTAKTKTVTTAGNQPGAHVTRP